MEEVYLTREVIDVKYETWAVQQTISSNLVFQIYFLML